MSSPKIGSWQLPNPLVLAPMAGVTDRPFRQLCRRLGAGLAVSEMMSADPKLRETRKSRLRANHEGEPLPRSVQIAGSDPAWLAAAAQYNVGHGAQIIDINMGCPAKKVCNRAAGSALLSDETLVREILNTVVTAVDVPVTLKIRTGIQPELRNAVSIARIAEDAGIAALAIHGRTRVEHYQGEAEYATISNVKQAVSIPVFANGDIDSPAKALAVLKATNADGLLIGRAAQGRPWIFREINHFLSTGHTLAPPKLEEIALILMHHLRDLHNFYGPEAGLRIARKHLCWYLKPLPNHEFWLAQLKRTESADEQLRLAAEYLNHLQREALPLPMAA